MSKSPQNLRRDVRRLAKIIRDGGYTYDQTKYLFSEARREVGLSAPKRKTGSVDRLTAEEFDALLKAAYKESGSKGLMIRTLLETGSRISAFCRMRVEDISFDELEIRFEDKGDKVRYVPILTSLAQELRLHIGDRESGFVWLSPRGGHYKPRRMQQVVKELAAAAGIQKNVYPHLLRHTVAQWLADRGMPENLLQQFLGHTKPDTTQVYYEARRSQVKEAFKEAMGK